MRTTTLVTLLAVASGCKATREPVDPELFSRQLMAFQAVRLADLKADIAYDEAATNASLQPGASVEFWDGEVSGTATGGSWTATGTGTHERGTDVFRWVSWDLQATLSEVHIDERTVSGSLHWTVFENLFEGAFLTHGLEGDLTIDDEPFEVELEAQLTPSVLNWVRGRLGATPIDWENPEPDLP